MDRITKSLVNDFLNQHEIKSELESKDFEKFCNYSIISKEYNNSFSVDDISTGDNQGIDGIGIIVNGKLVTGIEEIKDLIELNKFIEVLFVFIQSKTSSKFEGSEIGNFIFTIKDFFSETPRLKRTEEVANFLEITQFLYNKSPFMTKGKPFCKLYYITTGDWQGDTNLLAVINNGIQEIKSTNLFKDVIFEPCDANTIQKYYNKTKEIVNTTFNFKEKVPLPDINKIKEAYLGIVPFSEFKKIIIDENGNMRNIFYDNVRDYLGENLVNNKISSTLTNKQFDIFGVLNNGVTIVAESLTPVGHKFSISNYQIVNGCQTSRVLYNNKDIEGMENVYIPLRLIVTSDDNIKNQITIATNSQTEIKPEQLAALSEFQKNLEQYYDTIEGTGQLYYERLTNQYSSDNSVTKTRIITIPIQIKVFSAMFLNKPELVSGYYGKVAKNLGGNIFNSSHKFAPYYTSGLAYYRLESLFKNNSIQSKYKKARYHILMLCRLIINGAEIPPFNSKEINPFCENIINILNDSDGCLDMFNNVLKIIDKSGIDINNQKLLYQKSNTDLLLTTYKSTYPKVKIETVEAIAIEKPPQFVELEEPEATEITNNSKILK